MKKYSKLRVMTPDGRWFDCWQEHDGSGIPVYLHLTTKELIELPEEHEAAVLDGTLFVEPSSDAKPVKQYEHELRLEARRVRIEEEERERQVRALEREAANAEAVAAHAERVAAAKSRIDAANRILNPGSVKDITSGDIIPIAPSGESAQAEALRAGSGVAAASPQLGPPKE